MQNTCKINQIFNSICNFTPTAFTEMNWGKVFTFLEQNHFGIFQASIFIVNLFMFSNGIINDVNYGLKCWTRRHNNLKYFIEYAMVSQFVFNWCLSKYCFSLNVSSWLAILNRYNQTQSFKIWHKTKIKALMTRWTLNTLAEIKIFALKRSMNGFVTQ